MNASSATCARAFTFRWRASQPEGFEVNRNTANARIGTWLREVANPRLHATTGDVPLMRFELERERLQAMLTSRAGAIQNTRVQPPVPLPRAYQHSLKVYEELISAEVERVMNRAR